MSAAISQISQAVAVAGVGRVILTAVEQDAVTGQYVREVRVLAPDDGADGGRIVFVLQVRALTRAGVLIATPEQVAI